MKTIINLLIICLLASNFIYAQTTVTYTLDTNGEDATVDNNGPTNNYPNEIEYASRAWTISSTPVIWRNFFKFDLSCIPPNATIISANLSLYYAVVNGFANEQHSSLTHSNESILQRVTSAWTENTVTWNNQPNSTPTDQLILPQSTSGTQDYPNMSVTAMVQQMVSNPSMNFGFLLRLTNETQYASMIFASGDNPDLSKHPSITITYTIPVTDCITLRIDSLGEDATVDDYGPSNNYPNEIEYASRAWTISSTPVVWRNFFKFNLPCDLSNAIVQSAHLSLYYATINGFNNGQHSSLTQSNESILQLVTSPWAENTVTWNNQPNATSIDQVILPQSTSGTQDYTNIDVTAMVQQMVNNPVMNYGLLLRLTTETAYAQMFFASGDNPDTSKHPVLQICYTLLTSVNEIADEHNLSVFPNPATTEVTINFGKAGRYNVQLCNMLGEVLEQTQINSAMLSLDISSYTKGIYFITVMDDAKKKLVRKVIKT